MKKLFEELKDLEIKDKEEEDEQNDMNSEIIPSRAKNIPPNRSMGITEQFNLGNFKEFKRAKYSWSMSERQLNYIVGQINPYYNDWKDNIKWYQERTGQWHLYVNNPFAPNILKYVKIIDDDLRTYRF